MPGQIRIGCSGWKYNDNVEKGGWIGVFYPDGINPIFNVTAFLVGIISLTALIYSTFS